MNDPSNAPDGAAFSDGRTGRAAATTRRSFLKRLGRKAVYVTPVVMTLTAQQSRAAASPSNPSCVPAGGLCSDDTDCCSGTCKQGVCQ
jgi:hypothetical protein